MNILDLQHIPFMAIGEFLVLASLAYSVFTGKIEIGKAIATARGYIDEPSDALVEFISKTTGLNPEQIIQVAHDGIDMVDTAIKEGADDPK